ncbi:hypothetical protein [Streptomyces sp. NBC_01568]|uniref:hypothetical protein n=1 Tax=Streptomyces sp. NBC_01568 TaxID=2975882 RepID=UPI002F91AC80
MVADFFQTQGHVEVFKAFRAEIDRRSNIQHALVGAEVVAATALISVVVSHPKSIGALLTLPVISLIFAAQWYDHRATIESLGSEIGRLHEPLSNWERTGKPASWVKFFGLIATFITFLALSSGSIFALGVARSGRNDNPTWAIVWWGIDIGAALIQLAMAVDLVRKTDSYPRRKKGVEAMGLVVGPRN